MKNLNGVEKGKLAKEFQRSLVVGAGCLLFLWETTKAVFFSFKSDVCVPLVRALCFTAKVNALKPAAFWALKFPFLDIPPVLFPSRNPKICFAVVKRVVVNMVNKFVRTSPHYNSVNVMPVASCGIAIERALHMAALAASECFVKLYKPDIVIINCHTSSVAKRNC